MKYDGNVADYVKSFQFQHLVGLYTNQFPGGARDKGYTVTFDNGETLKVKRHVWRGEALRLNPSRSSFNRINQYIWRIPLVKCIFDETESPRIPRGRGKTAQKK